MKAIVAVSGNWGIGKDNDLLFHIPEDLKFFRSTTAGHTMIIGRKNLESFPGCRPLKNRRHLVLTRQENYNKEGIEVFHSMEELMQTLKDIPQDELWVCGGGVVYKDFLPYCESALVTHVDAEPDCSVFFPDLTKEPDWELTEIGEWKEHEGLRFRFCTWTNHNPQALPV